MATGSRIRDATFSVGSADGGSIAEGGRPAEEINPCFEKRRSPLLSQQRSLRQLSRRLSRRRAVVTAADTPSMPASTVSATPTAVSLPLTSVASAASILSLVSTAAFVEWAFMPTPTVTAPGGGSQHAWGIRGWGGAHPSPRLLNPTSAAR